jgi:hypothetical protein
MSVGKNPLLFFQEGQDTKTPLSDRAFPLQKIRAVDE